MADEFNASFEEGGVIHDGGTGYDGKSAYEIAVENGFNGTVTEWLESLKGDKGDRGEKGETGEKGADGKDGANGVDGKDGVNGVDGKSAYELAVDNGFSGTLAEWLDSLKGADGEGGNGLNTEAKNALIDCFANVAWTDSNGQARLERLQTALGIETPEPTPEPTQLIINGIDLSWKRGYIDANGGLAIAYAADGAYTSDFYTVNNYKTETINLENAKVYRHAFYDLNESFIMRTTDNDTSNKTAEIPDNAVYARATIVKTSLGNGGYNGDGTTITLTKDGE